MSLLIEEVGQLNMSGVDAIDLVMHSFRLPDYQLHTTVDDDGNSVKSQEDFCEITRRYFFGQILPLVIQITIIAVFIYWSDQIIMSDKNNLNQCCCICVYREYLPNKK